MQKGIIKEVREIAKEGKKTFCEVILQDGAKMSTFDTKIKQAESGDELEFDVALSGTYVNLKDGWKLTKKTSSAGESHTGGNGYQMSKEEWAAKQRIERESIEAQVAVKSILLLAASGYVNERLQKSCERALDWCDSRLDITLAKPVKKSMPTLTKSKTELAPSPEKREVVFDPSPVGNFGELWNRCKNFDIPKSEGLALMELKDQSEIVDLDETWRTIFTRKFPSKNEEVK